MTTIVSLARNNYVSTNVTTAAYVQLVSSLTSNTSMLEVYDGSGQSLVLAIGAAGSEVNKFYIVPGGNGKIPVQLRIGDRVSVKAISATANTGELLVNFFG